MRIPFDTVVLEAVVADIRPFVGGLLQRMTQPDPHSVVLNLYKGGLGEGALLISVHPDFYRMHFVTRRLRSGGEPSTFLSTLRSRILNSTLLSIEQIEGERLVEMRFEGETETHRLMIELMGKHSNVMLLDSGDRVVAAAKWVGPQKSSRVIQSGRAYTLPPVLGSGSGSPFWKKLQAAGPLLPGPILSHGHGAYPYSVAALGLPEVKKASISVALELHYDERTESHSLDQLRGQLKTDLERVIFAREVAAIDLEQAIESGNNAGVHQKRAELILAYGPSVAAGASVLQAWDYDGQEIAIKLDPDLDYKQNAERLFEKARHAKSRLGFVGDQLERIQREMAELQAILNAVEAATTVTELEELQHRANERKWLQKRTAQVKKEERPYQGHRIREAVGPGGFTYLYGETAEANDYLTVRVAKPNDLWLHVRGSTSAHVVILTGKHPEKVGREAIEYAAKIAVAHSTLKHSSYVPVDYTLKKYVRKPRGSAKGSVVYTHERTVHVDGGFA